MAGADKPFPQPRPTALDRLIDNEPTVVDKRPVPTDRCQCCGCTLESFKAREDPIEDPLHVIDLGMDVGVARRRVQLGSLCLCLWCLTALREHFVDPFIERHVAPMRRKLERVRAALEDRSEP